MADERPTEDEIDAAMQAECEAQAAELGVSVDDYLNEVLLQAMLREQAGVDPAPAAQEEPAPLPLAEAQLARQRLESIDRRLSVAVGGFESTVETIDRALAALTARTDDHEIRGERLGLRVEAALEELRETVDALTGRAGASEETLGSLSVLQEALREETRAQHDALIQRLAARIDEYDAAADSDRAAIQAQLADFDAGARAEFGRVVRMVDDWRASLQADLEAAFSQERAARKLTEARLDETQQALAHTRSEIQSDLQVVEARAEQRLSEHGAQARATLEAAAQRAERVAEEAQRAAAAAAQRAAAEVRACREAVEQSLIETATEVHARIDATRAETASYYDGLTNKLCESDRATAAKIADTRAQTESFSAALAAELSQTRQSLSETQTNLKALVEETTSQQRAALETVYTKLSDEISDVRERHLGGAARLKLFETSLGQVAADLSALRIYADERHSAAAAETAKSLEAARAQATAQSEALQANIDNVCAEARASAAHTGAAVETLEARTAQELAALGRGVESAIADIRAEAVETRDAAAAELADLRTEQKGALARLKLADEGLNAVTAAQGAANDKLALLSDRLERTQIEFTALGSVLREGMARVASRVDAAEAQMAANASSHVVSRLDDVVVRLDTHDAEAGDLVERTSSLGRLVSKLSTQYMEAMTSMQERLHKLEVGLADTRLERLADPDLARKTAQEVLNVVERRFAELSIELVQAADGGFEERLAALEQRSIAALEQVTQTVAALSKRAAAQPVDEDVLRTA
ncbi:hypothetical protein [Terricaulis sp.]|uniref:hypothetical protein n=1 Tax=Terricaulis sp. TaxID=2768686 RepID=UPI0037830542